MAPATDSLVTGAVSDVGTMAQGALSPPPMKAVLATRSYGTVTVDHRAHLARRAACRSCHGPGPVTKLHPLAPRIAHDRCIGCHKEQERGPVKCRGCHVLEEDAPVVPVEVAASTAPDTAATLERRALNAAAGEVRGPTTSAPPVPAWAAELYAAPAAPGAAARSVGAIGFSALSSGAAPAIGPSMRLDFGVEDLLFAQSFDWVSRPAYSRLLGLVGVGVARDLPRRARAFAMAVGGFDATIATRRPGLQPTLGARVGFGWEGMLPFRNQVALSVVGLSDLSGGREIDGERVGGWTVGLCASVGAAFGESR